MSRPKKVLFILPNLEGGGAERVVLTLLRFMDRKKTQPALYLLRKSGAYWDEVPEDVDIHYASSEGRRIRQNLATVISDMAHLVSSSDLVVGALELDATYFAYTWAKLYRKPIIGWVHTLIQPYLNTVDMKNRSLVKWIYPHLDKIVFPSQTAMDSMTYFIHLPPQKCYVIPNPLDVIKICALSVEELPPWASLIFKKPVIISVGRLEYEKGLDRLIQGHKLLLQRGVDHNLLILGEGRDREALEALVKALVVIDSVFMPGFMPNPYSFMARAQIYVQISRYEGFGLAMVEAQVLGIPVITTGAIDTTSDLIMDGVNGFRVPEHDLDALTAAMAKLLETPELRLTLGQAGAARASGFKPEAIADQWQSLVDEMAR